MSFEIEMQDGGALVKTRYFGLMTTADVHAAFSERFEDKAKIKKYKVLISDFVDVTKTDLDDVCVRHLADVYKNAASHNPNVVAVSIMPDGLLFGLGRMWEAYVDGIPWSESVVRTREEAQAFLNKELQE